MNIKIKTLIVIILAVATFYSCNNRPKVRTDKERRIKIVYTDWSEAVALTTLSKILLEEKMEYKVELKLTNVENAYREIAGGKAHIFADAWLPETHKKYYEKYGASLEKLGITYPGARTGLVVPEYSSYHSIEDLRNTRQPILGIDSGAGVTHQTETALKSYRLSGIALNNLSEQKMTDQFTEAFKRREEVVITGWEPHWIFARYDIRFLKDPKGVYGEKENIFTLGNKNIEKEHPQIVRYFERMQLSERQINSLIYYMNQEEDPENGIRNWIKKNEYVVNQWVKGLKPERKKIM